jgi:hypothetical protein
MMTISQYKNIRNTCTGNVLTLTGDSSFIRTMQYFRPLNVLLVNINGTFYKYRVTQEDIHYIWYESLMTLSLGKAYNKYVKNKLQRLN